MRPLLRACSAEKKAYGARPAVPEMAYRRCPCLRCACGVVRNAQGCPGVWSLAATPPRCVPVPHAPREHYPTAVACGSYGGPWRGTRRPCPPRPGLSVNPATRCSRKRGTHLYTKRRLIPTLRAMSVITTPSARSKIIWARRRSPAWMAVDRCQARSVWRSSGVRVIVRAVVRPRAHTASLCARGAARDHLGSREAQG